MPQQAGSGRTGGGNAAARLYRRRAGNHIAAGAEQESDPRPCCDCNRRVSRVEGVEPIKTEQRKHKFQWMNMQPQMLEVVGRTLGIIGFGEIGSETARRAQALGMHVLYNKRSRLPSEIEAVEGVSYAGKEELLSNSDFVLLSTPLTPETEKMIGAHELALMKPTAFLMTTSVRGGVIDEEALVAAMHSTTDRRRRTGCLRLRADPVRSPAAAM